MHPCTSALLDRLELRDGMVCVDVGCGGGDATREIARRVAPRDKAIGVDIDETKLELAREDARRQGVANVEFRAQDVRAADGASDFDLLYARFLLTQAWGRPSHLSPPLV